MASKITIFTRDHKRSGGSSEYQKTEPIDYIQKYTFTAAPKGYTTRVSLAKGTTTWFPNQISLGITSKTDDDIMDAPDIDFEIDKNGSKKDTSILQLNECKLKGVRINFQLDDPNSSPVLELFITYRRGGNKVLSREVIIRSIKLSHRIVMKGPIVGVSVDESVIKAGIAKREPEEKSKSEHSDHRPLQGEDDCNRVILSHKDYEICTISSPNLFANGSHAMDNDKYEPEQYIACPRSVSELEDLLDHEATPAAVNPLVIKLGSEVLKETYADHTFLAALFVIVGTCYARYITKHNDSIYFIGHVLPTKVQFEERFWALESDGLENISQEEDDDSDEEEFSLKDNPAEEEEEDADELLGEGEGIDEDNIYDPIESRRGDVNEEDDIQDDDSDEEESSSSSKKKRKRNTVEDFIDDEAEEECVPKKKKVAEVVEEAMELE